MNKEVHILSGILSVIFLVLFSCSKSELDEISSDDKVPTTYVFERNGKTSVDHSGQDTRLDMLSALEVKVKKAPTELLDATKLKEMYLGQGFATASLNESSKQLKNKTFSSHAAYYEAYLDQIAELSKLRRGATDAKEYKSSLNEGYVQRTTKDPKKDIMVNYLGLQTVQMFVKGLMGSCFLYQVAGERGYLDKVLEAPNEVVEGKNYTMKEHYFDEAFGYIGLPHDYKTSTFREEDDNKYYRFWAKYINSRGKAGIKGVDKDGSLTDDNIAETIFKAFIIGRKAIVDNKDEALKDQIAVIRRNLEKVSFAQALYYIKKGQDEKYKDDLGTQLHNYSEAVAFLAAPEYIKSPQYKSQDQMEHRLKELVLDKREIKVFNSGPSVDGTLTNASFIKLYTDDIKALYSDLK